MKSLYHDLHEVFEAVNKLKEVIGDKDVFIEPEQKHIYTDMKSLYEYLSDEYRELFDKVAILNELLNNPEFCSASSSTEKSYIKMMVQNYELQLMIVNNLCASICKYLCKDS